MININYVKPCNTIVTMDPESNRLADATLQNGRLEPGYQPTMGTSDGLTLPIALLRQNQGERVSDLIKTLGFQFLNLGTQNGATLLTELICNPMDSFDNFGLVKKLIGYGADLNLSTTQDFTSEQVGLIPKGATPLWIVAEKVRIFALRNLLLFYGAQVGPLALSTDAQSFFNEVSSIRGQARDIVLGVAPGARAVSYFIKGSTSSQELENRITRVREVQRRDGLLTLWRVEFGGPFGWTALEICLKRRNIPLAYYLLDTYGGHLIRAPRVLSILTSNQTTNGEPQRAFSDGEILGIVNRCAKENLVLLGQDLLEHCMKNDLRDSLLELLLRGVVPKNLADYPKKEIFLLSHSWTSATFLQLTNGMMKSLPLNKMEQSLYNLLTGAKEKLPRELLNEIGRFLQPKAITEAQERFVKRQEIRFWHQESEETKEEDAKSL